MERSPDLPDSLSRARERAGVRARELRQRQTEAEARLWHRLRNRQILGLKFRRQRAIGPYFADFACFEIGLVIEIDGGQHVEQHAYDQRRCACMQAHGFTTLRFWNHEVLNQTDAVMQKIWQVAQAALHPTAALTPTLSREREREQIQESE